MDQVKRLKKGRRSTFGEKNNSEDLLVLAHRAFHTSTDQIESIYNINIPLEIKKITLTDILHANETDPVEKKAEKKYAEYKGYINIIESYIKKLKTESNELNDLYRNALENFKKKQIKELNIDLAPYNELIDDVEKCQDKLNDFKRTTSIKFIKSETIKANTIINKRDKPIQLELSLKKSNYCFKPYINLLCEE
ncbi:unnamed protein product [Gordionus sp. m RMFG-2023]